MRLRAARRALARIYFFADALIGIIPTYRLPMRAVRTPLRTVGQYSSFVALFWHFGKRYGSMET